MRLITNTNVETAQPLEILSANTNTDISVATNKAVPPPKPPPLVADKRYNVVVYGLEESPKDTPRANRLKHDLEKLLNVLSGIDASLTATSIQDFHRLGKFKPNNTRPRPLLVKFLRTVEASLVLSKKVSLASSQVSIKRDLSHEERNIENALLKERRSLIDSGIERKFIKICGNSIYVKDKLHGLVQNSQFNTVPTHNDAPSPMDSNENNNNPDQTQA